MNESRRRLLTQYVGECWHDKTKLVGNIGARCLSCRIPIRWEDIKTFRRTFDTWPDFGKVVEALQEQGDWEEFYYYCTQICDRMLRPYEFTSWLLNPARFCELAGQWLERKGDGKGDCGLKGVII